ncbi:recombinase family protein [Bacillus sp. BRMEA1]|uniref:recombinase family protein n=1 Tax=Neobacillus endophyticus TaxID=2738405 RepID=UPI001563E688|nr:recombinase family protein [Neobacillus endophyticus]NRD80040.1 recombinase family protein [Neobacillus endophyticus]
MNKVHAAIYIRVSTEEQKNNLPLKAQESAIRDYAERKGFYVFDAYCNDGGIWGRFKETGCINVY